MLKEKAVKWHLSISIVVLTHLSFITEDQMVPPVQHT